MAAMRRRNASGSPHLKRLPEHRGARNDFGVNCMRMNPIAELWGWMGRMGGSARACGAEDEA